MRAELAKGHVLKCNRIGRTLRLRSFRSDESITRRVVGRGKDSSDRKRTQAQRSTDPMTFCPESRYVCVVWRSMLMHSNCNSSEKILVTITDRGRGATGSRCQLTPYATAVLKLRTFRQKNTKDCNSTTVRATGNPCSWSGIHHPGPSCNTPWEFPGILNISQNCIFFWIRYFSIRPT